MKRFYVDVVHDGAITFLVGPFADETSARRREIEAAKYAMSHGHMSPFDSVGVTSIEGSFKAPGNLNRHFELADGELLT